MKNDIFAQFANRYATEYGMSVFPCKENEKTPKTKTGFKEATADLSIINQWSANWPKANIGIATGAVSKIWVLDLDGQLAEDWLATMPELPATPEVKTGKGRHIYFKLPDGVDISNSAGRIAPNVDTRGNGGYVIAPPSIHPDGGTYRWDKDKKPSTTPFADAPEWLLNLVLKPDHKEKDRTNQRITANEIAGAERYVKRVLDEEFRILATAVQGSRNEQLFKSTVAMANYIGQGGVTHSIVQNLARAGAQSNGLWGDDGEHACLATIESALKKGLSNPKEVPERSQPFVTKPKLALVETKHSGAEDWKNDLLSDKNGLLKKSFNNGLVILEKHPAMEGVLIYNAFTDLVMLHNCPPWENQDGWRPRPIRDDDATACTSWLEKPIGGSLSMRPHDVYNIMLRVAKKHEIDPPKEWLQNLKWDGTERISYWLTDLCEAADDAYTKAVARKFLIGAVKRVMEPGSKVDSMLILESKQGDGKSTALRTLGTWGDQCYFTDQVDDITNKDALIQIQGVVLIEFAEMDTLNKADTDYIKKFITRQIDRYRPPYGKTLTDRPRRCVFAGTVNPGGNGYLKDPTGARRFWPVATGKILTEKLAADTPQLWAEAVVAWKRGEKTWIDDPEVMAMALKEQASRYEEEPWSDIIEREIAYVKAITVQQLMNVIDIPKERRDRRASVRIGNYLRHKGWTSKKDYRPDGESSNPQRRFYAPESHIVQIKEVTENDHDMLAQQD